MGQTSDSQLSSQGGPGVGMGRRAGAHPVPRHWAYARASEGRRPCEENPMCLARPTEVTAFVMVTGSPPPPTHTQPPGGEVPGALRSCSGQLALRASVPPLQGTEEGQEGGGDPRSPRAVCLGLPPHAGAPGVALSRAGSRGPPISLTSPPNTPALGGCLQRLPCPRQGPALCVWGPTALGLDLAPRGLPGTGWAGPPLPLPQAQRPWTSASEARSPGPRAVGAQTAPPVTLLVRVGSAGGPGPQGTPALPAGAGEAPGAPHSVLIPSPPCP